MLAVLCRGPQHTSAASVMLSSREQHQPEQTARETVIVLRENHNGVRSMNGDNGNLPVSFDTLLKHHDEEDEGVEFVRINQTEEGVRSWKGDINFMALSSTSGTLSKYHTEEEEDAKFVRTRNQTEEGLRSRKRHKDTIIPSFSSSPVNLKKYTDEDVARVVRPRKGFSGVDTEQETMWVDKGDFIALKPISSSPETLKKGRDEDDEVKAVSSRTADKDTESQEAISPWLTLSFFKTLKDIEDIADLPSVPSQAPKKSHVTKKVAENSQTKDIEDKKPNGEPAERIRGQEEYLGSGNTGMIFEDVGKEDSKEESQETVHRKQGQEDNKEDKQGTVQDMRRGDITPSGKLALKTHRFGIQRDHDGVKTTKKMVKTNKKTGQERGRKESTRTRGKGEGDMELEGREAEEEDTYGGRMKRDVIWPPEEEIAEKEEEENSYGERKKTWDGEEEEDEKLEDYTRGVTVATSRQIGVQGFLSLFTDPGFLLVFLGLNVSRGDFPIRVYVSVC